MRKEKGAISIKAIIGLVLAVGAIVILLPIILKFYGFFIPTADQGSRESLENLDSSIKALLESSQRQCYTDLYIQANRAVVGFDSGTKETLDLRLVNEKIMKPTKKCGIYPCICLCDGGKGDLEEEDCLNAAVCYHYPELMRFKGRYEGIVEDLILYGESTMGFNEGIRFVIIEVSVDASGNKDTIHIYRTDNVGAIKPCEELFPVT